MQKLWIVFVLVACVACSSSKKEEGVLTQPQLTALLVDVYIAEARIDQIPVVKDSSIRFYVPFEEKMLKNKGLTDAILRKTYAYYFAHPKELEQVYDAVIDTLALREQRLFMKTHAQTPGRNPHQ